MMDASHEWFVGLAKSFGLFYLVALSIGITVYAFWPSLGTRFDKAAKSILDDEEGPARTDMSHAGGRGNASDPKGRSDRSEPQGRSKPLYAEDRPCR